MPGIETPAPQVARLDLADGREEGDRQVAVGRHHAGRRSGRPAAAAPRPRARAPTVRATRHQGRRGAVRTLHPHRRPPVRLGDRGAGRSRGGGSVPVVPTWSIPAVDMKITQHHPMVALRSRQPMRPPSPTTPATRQSLLGSLIPWSRRSLGVTSRRRVQSWPRYVRPVAPAGQRAAATGRAPGPGRYGGRGRRPGPAARRPRPCPDPTAAPSSHPARAPPNWTRL